MGAAGAANMSNPDAFGYVWEDDLPYNWPGATQGSRTNIEGDDSYGTVELGFTFPFYEGNWDRASVSTNGFLSFGNGTAGCCGRYPFPLRRFPNNVIAPFWADLVIDADEGGGIWVLRRGSAPNRSVVIEWHRARSSVLWRLPDLCRGTA